MPGIEFDYYIPPDCAIEPDGSILPVNYPKLYRFNKTSSHFLFSFTGMGMPPIKYITQQGPQQHGETILDYRLQPRLIQYIHRRQPQDCGRTPYWNARADILNLLRPNRQCVDSFDTGKLRKILPDGSVRDIDAIIQQGPVFTPRNISQWDEWAFTETLLFKCADPTFYDPAQLEVSAMLASRDELTFPITFPIIFDSEAISEFTSLTYTGTWLSFPIIYITGPITGPTVENQTTGKKIELNYQVAVGQQITIDTTYGNKTIIDNSDTNLIGTLTDDSDIAEFCIQPDPIAPGGVNILHLSGTKAEAGTNSIRLTYHTRYIGI